jgi:hypothetical protein
MKPRRVPSWFRLNVIWLIGGVILLALGRWWGLVLVLVAIGESYRTSRRRDGGVRSVDRTSSIGVRLEISGRAAESIVDHGGTLFLWQEEIGSAWLRDRVAFTQPATSATFRAIPAGHVTLMIADDVPLPRQLKISMQRLSSTRPDVEWDGRVWGRRGGADGG